jgi:DNA-binding Lrp family transcriptional regulator
VVAPDPVDIRLLSLVAEMGRAAVHDVAARLGMDPREVASRLVALSGSGLPLIVGVECDQYGLRNAIANAGTWRGGYQQTGSVPYPQQQQRAYPPAQQPGMPSGPYPAPVQQVPSAPIPVAAVPQQTPQSTWGPPQSSSWARGDQPAPPATWTAPPTAGAAPQRARVGESLSTEGPGGEQFSIQLVEVVDPADFLFTAAGYRLREGERSVVVHTELTNRGSVPFPQLPDLYLVLVAKDGQAVEKAPVQLQSRPPHRIGVRPGETAGGHTVYVLPESTDITAVRWTYRPDDEQNALLWSVEQ